MLSPFNAPLRLDAFDAPNWVLCLLVTVAVTATVVVAGHRHADADVAVPRATDANAPAAVATPAPVRREVPISRSATRRGHALARAGALPRKHRALPREHRALPRKHRARPATPHKPVNRKAHRSRAPQLPAAPSDAHETVAAARRSSSNVPGHCLQWSREQAGIPSKYVDAATAWENAAGRHPADPTPPLGAAVYWTGGSSGYGHIAISVGHGKVRSSDAGGTGEVATVPIRRLSSTWHLRYAGWANSINGYRIVGV